MTTRQNVSPRGSNQLLHNKLMPPRPGSNIIRRDDLLARLDQGLTRKLTVVTAPTGFGKTTLVSMWIASRQFGSAWVTLDENDNDSARFWTYVISALRTLDSAVGKTTLSMLMASQPPSFQTLLTPLINDIVQLNGPCVLVLEDYHSITSKEIMDGVSFLLQHVPESLHLTLITRTELDLPLPLLRVRDELIEINTADLRFDQEETESFLHTVIPVELPSQLAHQLLQKTEGWVAGLRLVAMSLQHEDRATEVENLIRSFSGRDRYIADYLLKEVFDSQSEAVQSFLLNTCFFSRLTSSLCDAITETSNSGSMLEQIERDNLFITQLEHRGDQTWYRYNPMFAESIQYLARQRLGDVKITSLFEKASDWYEYQGLFDEAIETALTAKLFDRAMKLIEKFIEIHDFSEMQTLGRWLESIPQQDILLHAAICFTYAQIILYSTDRFAPATKTRIEPFLHAAESAWRVDENHQRLGQVLSFRGIVVWWQGDFSKAFEYARQSLAELPEYDVLWRGTSLLIVSYEALNAGRILDAQDEILEARALLGAAQNIYGVLAALQMLSQIFYWQGDLEQAEQLNRQIVTEAVGDESMLDDQGFASLSLADIAYEKNELVEAEQLAARAVNLAEQRGNELLKAQATIRLAYIQAARNDFQHASELMKPLVSGMQHPNLLREIQEAQSRLSILSGELFALKGWQALISNDQEIVLDVQKEREAFTLARLRIAEEKAIEALEILNDRAADAAENGRARSQITALCLEALAHRLMSDLTRAKKSLSEALTIGQTKGFRRIFLDEGMWMAVLLQAILPTLPNRTMSLFASTLLHSFSPEVTSHLTATSLTVQIEPLSPQELRVLRLLVAGLSNADIAQELVVSTNTIKTHVKSIYRKLNVNSREEARELTRELRLL
jgi:LuxR family transcriptional regulator, maltose regulon positive regulatory protein